MPGSAKFIRTSLWVALAVAVALLGLTAWSNDFITLQGERTVYSAVCQQGVWVGDRCTGVLAAGDRYRFRALKPRGEVFFWISGSPERSGRFTECVITDGRNWTCKANADAPRSITLQLSGGRPVIDPAANTRQFHAVSKIRWVLLKYGLSFGDRAAAP
ncbi:MAG: hypothetical protein HY017_33565 [Betaproteobacteria bacterium]|nr:hypothetical protein [Betaproteobacteria bacterium]